jgi:hypothetical protein
MPIIPPRVVGLIQMARGLHVHNTAGASDAGSKKNERVYTRSWFQGVWGYSAYSMAGTRIQKGMPPSPVLWPPTTILLKKKIHWVMGNWGPFRDIIGIGQPPAPSLENKSGRRCRPALAAASHSHRDHAHTEYSYLWAKPSRPIIGRLVNFVPFPLGAADLVTACNACAELIWR